MENYINPRLSRALIFILVLIQFACDSDKRIESKQNVDVSKNIYVPIFQQDSAFNFIKSQVEFGPRVPNSSGHERCQDYLVAALKGYGGNVVEQNFEATAYNNTKLNLTNIIASFATEKKKRILLGAHWDSRPFADKDSVNISNPIDGANDGASGVGVLLEIARQLQINPPLNVGVDIILFDGEDYGIPNFDTGDYSNVENSGYCLGSNYWSQNKHVPNYSAYYGILLDMVGGKEAKFYKEGVSMNYAPSIVRKVWTNAKANGYDFHFVNKNSDAITDDHLFVNAKAKIPMIDIIEFNPESNDYFGTYHHRHNDNLDVIDRNTLKAVGQTLLYTIYHE